MLRLPKDDTYISDSVKNYIAKELGSMWNDVFKIDYIGYLPLKFEKGVCVDTSKTFSVIPNYQMLFMHTDDNAIPNTYIVQEILIPLNTNKIFQAVISKTEMNSNYNSYETLIQVTPTTGLVEISSTKWLSMASLVFGSTDTTRLTETNSLAIYGIGLKKKFKAIKQLLTSLFSILFNNKRGGVLIA